MHKFKEGDLWLLTSIFDQRLTEISVIVGILGAISALPIFKSIGNWSQRRRKHKADRLTEAIAKATRPLIESYHREHQEIMDKLADQDETSISLLHDRVYIDGQLSAENAVLRAQLKFCQNKIADNQDSAE